MTGTHRPQGGGHPGDPDGGERRQLHVWVDGGDVKARIENSLRDVLDRRAANETDRNRSEFVRHALAYAARYMPVGWRPEEDQARPAS